MSWTGLILSLALTVLVTRTGEARPPRVLGGPVVVLFDRPPENLGPDRPACGIFRNDEPAERQHIEEAWMSLRLPSGQEKNFLTLPYNVSGKGSYCGWFLKLGGADWNRFHEGELVLVMRRLDPRVDRFKRSIKLKLPDTTAASNWKVELKGKQPDGKPALGVVRVHVERPHEMQQRRDGYFEMRVPLKGFLMDLGKLEELVLVLENAALPATEQRGALGLHAILLTSRRGGSVKNLVSEAERALDDLGVRASVWFQKHRSSLGLVLDRAPNREDFRPDPDRAALCSVASVGYALSLLPEDVRLARLTRDRAQGQAEQTLRSLLEKVEHKDGIFYHFVDSTSGKRWDRSEVSTLDTAIALNGAVVAGTFFGGRVAELADRLLDRADWSKFVTADPRTRKPLLALGWSPEKGLLGPADVRSSEMAMAYLIAIGSKNGIDPACWYNTRVEYSRLLGHRVLNARHPLFTSYYGLGWHDLRGLVDKEGTDLFGNARQAALLNRDFCRAEGKTQDTYRLSEGGFWGVSAGDMPGGKYAAPGLIPGDADGVVWPMTALAALPWAAEEIKQDLLRWQHARVWSRINGPYGLAPFRLGSGQEWIAPDLIGIDLGAYALSLANHRNRTIWDLWMRHSVSKNALKKIGFRRP